VGAGAGGVGAGGATGAGAGGVAGMSGAGAGGIAGAGMGSEGGTTTAGAGGGDPMQSSGCGSTTAPQNGVQTIDVDGMSREYILAVPDDYDANNAYPLIFGWHWRGGSAENVAGSGFNGGYYGLQDLANGSAIFVAPEGLDAGWANTGGRDIAFLEAMLERFKSELCIDESRIFSTGFSYGGMMSFAVGCAMGDVFRAIAPMSGALYSGCEDGSAPVAVWGAHGAMDDVVPLDDGEAGLQVFLERNNCGTATVATDPSPCVTYEGCDAGYPVTWCEFQGGHSPPQFAAEAIWEFFSQF
jgi:poly(3-hydroxybutyrate) depolymerase